MNRAQRFAIPASLFLLAFAVLYIRLGYVVGGPTEFSEQTARSYRIAMGQVPYRDFYMVATPLTYYIHAIFLRLGHFHYRALQLYMAMHGAACVAGTYVFCRRFLGHAVGISSAFALSALLWSPLLTHGIPNYDFEATAFALWAVVAFGYAHEGRAWGAVAMGACCAAVVLCKQNLGAAAVVVGAAVLLVKDGR